MQKYMKFDFLFWFVLLYVQTSFPSVAHIQLFILSKLLSEGLYIYNQKYELFWQNFLCVL